MYLLGTVCHFTTWVQHALTRVNNILPNIYFFVRNIYIRYLTFTVIVDYSFLCVYIFIYVFKCACVFVNLCTWTCICVCVVYTDNVAIFHSLKSNSVI